MVFKRVRESVFEDLLSKYKCRPELKTEKDDEREETDEEEGDDEEVKERRAKGTTSVGSKLKSLWPF